MLGILKISAQTLKYRNPLFSVRHYGGIGAHVTTRYYSKRVRNDSLSCRNINEIKEKPETCTAPTPPNCNPDPKQENEVLQQRNQSTDGGTYPKPPTPPQGNNFWKLLLAAAVGAAGVGYVIYSSKDEPKILDLTKKKQVKVPVKVPSSSKDIPKHVPYLLIGGGTASFSAFRAIKSHDPKAKVMVVSNENEMPYMRPPLSKELWFNADNLTGDTLKFKQWNGVERSLYYEPDDFYVDPTKLDEGQNGGVTIVRGYTVKELDVCGKKAILTDGTEIKYDEVLIATGSAPKNLDIFQSASMKVKEKISIFKTIEDFENLRTAIDKKKSVVIIGGGFLGSELSCALAKYGENKNLKVHQIFYENGNMGKVLPEYLSNWTTDRVREEGVNVLSKSQVKSVDLVGSQLKLSLMDGTNVMCDHIVVAIGSQPNTNLAETSGLETDSKHGGFVVNAELEARRHVFVAGDAACFYDPKLGRRRVEHHDHAVVSGRLAGENMVGLKKPYLHQSMFWSDLGPKIGYEAIGLIDSSLETVGVFAKKSDLDTPTASTTNNLEGTKPNTETEIPVLTTTPETTDNKPTNVDSKKSDAEDDYGKGIIFYVRDNKIVGIILWNVFNRINIARKIIGEGKEYSDLNEVAKLFDIYEQH